MNIAEYLIDICKDTCEFFCKYIEKVRNGDIDEAKLHSICKLCSIYELYNSVHAEQDL